jgi:glucose-1-phosphate thymidylyltransferase
MDQKRRLKGEYFLADAINIMLESGAKMRTQRVQTWLDAGTAQTVLETNRYLLKNGHDNTDQVGREGNITVIPPVYVHPTAFVEASVIGPYASIGPGCTIKNSVIRDSVIEKGAQISEIILEGSLIGENTIVEGGSKSLNIGDNSKVIIQL